MLIVSVQKGPYQGSKSRKTISIYFDFCKKFIFKLIILTQQVSIRTSIDYQLKRPGTSLRTSFQDPIPISRTIPQKGTRTCFLDSINQLTLRTQCDKLEPMAQLGKKKSYFYKNLSIDFGHKVIFSWQWNVCSAGKSVQNLER